MTQKPQIGKSIYMREVARGINSNRAIHNALRRIVDECGSRNAVVSMLAAQAAMALTTNLDALHELERIVVENEKQAGRRAASG
jgi:stage III sporulation protein SpoIIIAA